MCLIFYRSFSNFPQKKAKSKKKGVKNKAHGVYNNLLYSKDSKIRSTSVVLLHLEFH